MVAIDNLNKDSSNNGFRFCFSRPPQKLYLQRNSAIGYFKGPVDYMPNGRNIESKELATTAEPAYSRLQGSKEFCPLKEKSTITGIE